MPKSTNTFSIPTIYFQLLLLLSLTPYVAGTFFPFTSFRPPVYPSSRYRPARSSQNNFVPLQSSALGVRVLVPRALYDLFSARSPYSPPSNYPRPPPPPPPYQPPFNGPFNPRPYNPFQPPNDFPPGNRPGAFQPPITPNTLFNLMRAFYPHLIYQPDPRYPNVFAIRLPAEPNPPVNLPDFNRDPLGPPPPPQQPVPPLNSPGFNDEIPPNETEFFEPPLPPREFTPPPPPLLPQRASSSQQAQNQQSPFGSSSLPYNTNNYNNYNNYNNNNNNALQRRSPQNQLIFIRPQ